MKDGTRHEVVDRERAELKKVLASPLFSRAPALSRILAFICEKHFRGESDSIKEYSIAVEALGRSPDFDSSSDTIVRVEASRLRRRLREYYDGEGADHPIRILLAESGYVPQFIARTEAEGEADKQEDSEAPATENAPHASWWTKLSLRGLGAQD